MVSIWASASSWHMLKYTWHNIDLTQYLSQIIDVKWHIPLSYYINIRDLVVKRETVLIFDGTVADYEV